MARVKKSARGVDSPDLRLIVNYASLWPAETFSTNSPAAPADARARADTISDVIGRRAAKRRVRYRNENREPVINRAGFTARTNTKEDVSGRLYIAESVTFFPRRALDFKVASGRARRKPKRESSLKFKPDSNFQPTN